MPLFFSPFMPGALRRHLSPLTARVLAVNVLALALLVGGLLFLGRYQERLIQNELTGMRIEAHIYADALSEAAVRPTADESQILVPDLARPMIRRLVETTHNRTRLFSQDGTLVADSRVLMDATGMVTIEELPPPSQGPALLRLITGSIDALATALPDRKALPLFPEASGPLNGFAEPVIRALSAEPNAQAWRMADGSLLLGAAVPVQHYKEVLGAVLLTRAGTSIDSALRAVRLDILRIFLLTLAVTVLLSLYLAGTLTGPIRRLAQAAERMRHTHGRQLCIPDLSYRGDEIGDLSAALRDMTEALWTRMDAIAHFAADVAHEIKNPLTSLRSAVETVRRVNDPERRERLLQVIEADIRRLDRLITDIAAASRLDAELSRAEPEPVDVGSLLTALADTYAPDPEPDSDRPAKREPEPEPVAGLEGQRPAPPQIVLELPASPLRIMGLEGRLGQAFRNLLENALSFSPPGGTVTLAARPRGGQVEIIVADQGPGIPEDKAEAIFARFYSERPANEAFGLHSGLGLSIARQIILAHGGALTARNRRSPEGRICGACFTVVLPEIPALG